MRLYKQGDQRGVYRRKNVLIARRKYKYYSMQGKKARTSPVLFSVENLSS